MSYLKSILKPLNSTVAAYFLILNLLSNLAELYYNREAVHVYHIMTLSFLFAYVETGIYYLIKNKYFKRLYLGGIVLIHSLLIITDYFLLYKFHRIINQDVLDILAETNHKETLNFVQAYLSPITILTVIALYLMCNGIIILISRLLKKNISSIYIILAFLGILSLSYGAFSFIKFGNGMGIPQCTAYTRVLYSAYTVKKRMDSINQLSIVCKRTTATSEDPTMPIVVLVIGESHSVYHSSLYGYSKDTSPLLTKRFNNGDLYIFNDAVAIDDHTHGVMKSVFSLDSLGINFNAVPLFPSCFKKANYHTELWDNQYKVGQGISFLSDKELSSVLFDKRNSKFYKYDIDMVNDVSIHDSTLYIFHLWGQHYTYKNRYPSPQFNHFKPSDYDEEKNSLHQRKEMAEYDNATRYNDFVLNTIISKFEEKNAIVIYISDHGEEVYDIRNYMGHGDAATSPDYRYQIRVPFIIWMSPQYKDFHPLVFEKIKESMEKPISTDNISHFLLEIASIKSPYFSPYRSFINKKYNGSSRIVLKSIKYKK